LGGLLDLVRPLPIGGIRPVSTMLERVVAASDLIIVKLCQRGPAGSLESGHVLDYLHCQREAINSILDRQFQRRIDIALFPVTVHVEVVMVRTAIGQTMNEPGISVEIENDRLIDAEKQIEVPIRQTVRMVGLRLQPQQVDDIDVSNLE